MFELMVNGGPIMWPILILGGVGLGTAAWFAVRAEGRVRGFLDSMSRSVVCVTLVSLALDLMATCFAVKEVPPEQKGPILVQGFGESMSPLVLGFALLALMHLLTAVGQRRLDARKA
jgi:hypothetical protein